MTQKTARDMLDELRVFFAEASASEAQKLWDVLSALRGPDDGDLVKKTATTAIVRRAALGDSLRMFCMVNDDSPELADFRLGMTGNHFQNHASWAFKALDLQWGKNNARVDLRLPPVQP